MYSAKKRAEASPGVGRDTDLFSIDRSGWSLFQPGFVKYLDKLHTEFEATTKSNWDAMERQLRSAFDEIEKGNAPQN
jgi:hypothetical protein